MTTPTTTATTATTATVRAALVVAYLSLPESSGALRLIAAAIKGLGGHIEHHHTTGDLGVIWPD
jgi:hypothetical protein